MKKKIKHILIIMLATIVSVACSKEKDSPAPEVTGTTPLPEVISLVYSYGRTVMYTMDYNEDQQLMGIDIAWQYGSEHGQWTVSMEYNEKRSVVNIYLEDVDSGYNYDTSFDYDANGEMSDIVYTADGDVRTTNFIYDPNNRIYGIDGDLGNFPMGWKFDQDNNLTEMVISDNYFQLTSSGNEKGVFHNLDPQPALTIWYGLLFYLSPYELYFFHQKDLDRFEAIDFYYDYGEKVRDGDGNLIAFKMIPDDPLAGTISYTISYKGY